MRFRMMTAAAAVLAMTATPVAAASANPAAALSVGTSARASTPTANTSELAGGGLFGLIIAAGIVAIGVIAIVNDEDGSDSN